MQILPIAAASAIPDIATIIGLARSTRFINDEVTSPGAAVAATAAATAAASATAPSTAAAAAASPAAAAPPNCSALQQEDNHVKSN